MKYISLYDTKDKYKTNVQDIQKVKTDTQENKCKIKCKLALLLTPPK